MSILHVKSLMALLRERPRAESGAAVRRTDGLPTAPPATHQDSTTTDRTPNELYNRHNSDSETLRRCKNDARSSEHRDNTYRPRRETRAATHRTQHTTTTTETTTQGAKSRVRQCGSEHNRSRSKETSPAYIFKFRVFPLITTWVLISTISMCACTHYTVNPLILANPLNSPTSHLTLHTPASPLQRCLSKALTHKNYTLSSHPILYHTISPILHQQWTPPSSTSAPYTIHASSPPTHHNIAHTEVSKLTCTYHHTNVTTKQSTRSKKALSLNLPSKRQGRCCYRGRCCRRSKLLRTSAHTKAKLHQDPRSLHSSDTAEPP